MARAPDIVRKTFELHGERARVVAELLDVESHASFEASCSSEHRALPERDAALRDPRGFLSSSLHRRTSTMIRITATRSSDMLRLDGYFADADTGYPRSPGPRWGFGSPAFLPGTPPPGWRALHEKLEVGVPVEVGGFVVVRERRDSWDDNNQPIVDCWIGVRFDD